MEHLAEAVLELLFGLLKNKPDPMPELEYRAHFTIKYPTKKILVRMIATLIFVAAFSVLWVLVHHETRYLFAVFVILGIVLLIFLLDSLSFRCTVDEAALRCSRFGLRRKEARWEDVICVRVIEEKNERAVILALYDREGNCVLDLNTDMQNAWYIVKMAEHMQIEIRKEKDLTPKEMKRL